jgi:hypothetical protein
MHQHERQTAEQKQHRKSQIRAVVQRAEQHGDNYGAKCNAIARWQNVDAAAF